ncbi:MAG: ABC transporter permease [Lysobacteraceae bacterium]
MTNKTLLAHPAAPKLDASASGMLRALFLHRRLVMQLVRRDILGRYQGSFFGVAWSLVTPLLMLTVYTFVFSVVFGARWGSVSEQGGKLAFAVVLFAGLLVFNLFGETINRAPGLILANANYVKRVIFPLEVLPLVALLASLFHAAIALLAWAAIAIFVLHGLPWTIVLLPLVLVPLLLGTLGVSWMLASLGVYARDIGQVTSILTMALLFLSPIFFPLSAVPERFRAVVMLNPMSFIIESARGVLIDGHPPDWLILGGFWIGGALIAWLGWWWFQKTREGFADVI